MDILRSRSSKVLLLATSLFLALSCKKDKSLETGKSRVSFRFENSAQGIPLQLEKKYTNPFGEDYTVTTLKYHISDITISDSSKNISREKTCCHLLDASDSTSLHFDAQLDEISFDRVSFIIGVDSLYNVSGAQTGALDPVHGMFWTWNTGYIMAKLEGESSVSSAPVSRFQYHIGGYAGSVATQRKVTLTFPGGRSYSLKADQPLTMIIDVNISKWFRSAHDLPIASQPLVMTPGPLAMQYADNYACLFTVKEVQP